MKILKRDVNQQIIIPPETLLSYVGERRNPDPVSKDDIKTQYDLAVLRFPYEINSESTPIPTGKQIAKNDMVAVIGYPAYISTKNLTNKLQDTLGDRAKQQHPS